MTTSQSIENNQQESTCVENQHSSYLSLGQLWLSQLTEKLRQLIHLKSQRLLAYQGVQLGLVALTELVKSKRIISGVVLIWIIAPLAEVSYQMFNPAVINKSWYYLNTYYYLYHIGAQLKLLCWSVGAFLLFPTKWKFRYLAIIVPVGATVTKIIHFTFFVTDNISFHAPAAWPAVIGGLFLAPAILVCADYLIYRKYHTNDGNIKRIEGLILCPGIEPKIKIELLRSLIEERQNFYSRI